MVSLFHEKSDRQVLKWTDSKQAEEPAAALAGTEETDLRKDTQHGELEKYNRWGCHLGSVDAETGEITKGPIRGRFIET